MQAIYQCVTQNKPLGQGKWLCALLTMLCLKASLTAHVFNHTLRFDSITGKLFTLNKFTIINFGTFSSVGLLVIFSWLFFIDNVIMFHQLYVRL